MSDDLYKTAQPAPIYSFSDVTIGGQNTLAGQIISLNTKHTSTFGIGDIWLTSKNYWATVSKDMPDKYYQVISKGLKTGSIVWGKKRVLPIDRNPETLKEWYQALNLEGGRTPKMVAAFKSLIAKRIDGKYTLGEITRYCMAEERKGKNREEVLTFLKEVYGYVEFRDKQYEYDDSNVVEDEEGKVEVTLVQTSEGVQIVGDPTDPNFQASKDRMSEGKASKVLDDVFGTE